MKYRFYRENNKWYIDLPEFIEAGGDKESLEMVFGADDFLGNYLTFDDNEVFLILSTEKLRPGRKEPTLIKSVTKLDSGTFYVYDSLGELRVLWLCEVTRFVFNGEFPETIYFTKITKEQYESNLS